MTIRQDQPRGCLSCRTVMGLRRSSCDDLVELAAARVRSGGLVGLSDVDAAEALAVEVGAQARRHDAAHLVGIGVDVRLDSEPDPADPGLHELGAPYPRCFQERDEGQGRDAHGTAVLGSETQHVVAPPGHPQRGQGAAARAGVGTGQHRVPQVVAEDRLDAVRQVREQHGVGRTSGGRGREIGLHGFQHQPVAVHVHPAVGAVEAQGVELRRAVDVVRRRAERGGRAGPCLGRHRLSTRLEQDRVDAEPSGRLLVGEQAQHARVGRQRGGIERVEPVDEGVQAVLHREDPVVAGAIAVAATFQLQPAGGRIVTPVGEDGGPPAPPAHEREPVRRRQPVDLAPQAQPSIGRDRLLVVDEQPGVAGGAGAGAHEVRAQEGGADAVDGGDERLDPRPGHAGIGDPVVEGGHQLPLGHRGQLSEGGGVRQSAVARPVERGGGPGVRHRRGEASALPPGQSLASVVLRAPQVGHHPEFPHAHRLRPPRLPGPGPPGAVLRRTVGRARAHDSRPAVPSQPPTIAVSGGRRRSTLIRCLVTPQGS